MDKFIEKDSFDEWNSKPDYSKMSDVEFAKRYNNFMKSQLGLSYDRGDKNQEVAQELANEMTLRGNLYGVGQNEFLKRFGQIEEERGTELEKRLKRFFVDSLGKSRKISSLNGKGIEGLKDYLKNFGRTRVFLDSEEKTGINSATGEILVNDFYNFLGITLEGEGFKYDNRREKNEEVKGDLVSRFREAINPLELIEEGENFFIIRGSS
jgi:hypothetical protein